MNEKDRKEAERLVKEALESFLDSTRYESPQDEVGNRGCCGVLSYKPHTKDCPAVKAMGAFERLAAEPEHQPCKGIPRKGCNYLAACDSICNKCGKVHSAMDLFVGQHIAGSEQEPVGEVGAMPGTQGFTMAAFKADQVPIGTKLYRNPPPLRELNYAAIERIREEVGVNAWWDAGYEDREEFYELMDKFARAIIAAARSQP
ncbi:MAG: hypothetical protein KGI54_16660, partial [Pseudomonadota bacterium]|nr:hypothetical protein [Pseudomonadota bacterium]